MSVTFGQIKNTSDAATYTDSLAIDFLHYMASQLETLIPGSTTTNTDTGFNITWKGYTWKCSHTFNNGFGVNFDCYKSDDLATKITSAACSGGRNYTNYPYSFWVNYQLTKNETTGEYYLWFCDSDGVTKTYQNPQFCRLNTTDGTVLEGATFGAQAAMLRLFGENLECAVNYNANNIPKATGALFVSGNFEATDTVVYTPVILTDTGGFPMGKITKSLVYISSNKLSQSSSYILNGRQYHVLLDMGVALSYGTHTLVAFDCGEA